MAEHKGTSFVHSCVKVPVDPFSRQPTPMYERPKIPAALAMPEVNNKSAKARRQCEQRKTNSRSPFANPNSSASSRLDNRCSLADPESARDDCRNYLEYFDSIPDYCDIHHLSNEQFRQKLDYLKRKQRILLKNLRNCLEQDENIEPLTSHVKAATTPTPAPAATTSSEATTAPTIATCSPADNRRSLMSDKKSCSLGDHSELTLKGKRCNFEESRVYSPPPPPIYPSGSFSCLAEDQDLLTYRCRYLHEKASKTRHNEAILSASKDWSSGSEESTVEKGALESYTDKEIGIETKSLPPRSPKKWQPTMPKPFSFTLRDEAEKYMAMVEQQAAEEYELSHPSRKNPAKKRRIRPVPLTSKIPLYDKLMAEKEERSRIVREESALSLLSQVRPFKLECDRRALRALTRSSPELSSCLASGKIHCPRFRAKPVPRDLFSADIYDRMLEDEYFRNLQKRIRSVELMKSASLPPSMARRERCKSAVSFRSKSSSEERTRSGRDSIALCRGTPLPSERSRCSAMTSVLPPHGNNLAAILRAQASREKMEREVQQRLEEKRYEQMLRLRKALIGRKPAWRALRSAARHEHERDLDFRASLRRDEAREQAERHRCQMEMMLDRVTQIPTLFERYSQSFQDSLRLCPKLNPAKIPTHHCSSSGNISSTNISSAGKKKKKKKKPRQSSSSADSYVSIGSSSRPNSGSLTSSSGTIGTSSHSSGHSHKLLRCTSPKSFMPEKKKTDRGPLKVSINETAELIEDVREEYEETFSMDSATSQVRQEREKRVLADEHEEIEKE